MTKLRLKVFSVSPNGGAVILVPEKSHEVKYFNKKTDKTMTEAQFKNAKPGEAERRPIQIHPTARMILVPMKDDKTKYAVDQVYEIELKKV